MFSILPLDVNLDFLRNLTFEELFVYQVLQFVRVYSLN
jgi:hypothetical protein